MRPLAFLRFAAAGHQAADVNIPRRCLSHRAIKKKACPIRILSCSFGFIRELKKRNERVIKISNLRNILPEPFPAEDEVYTQFSGSLTATRQTPIITLRLTIATLP